MGRDVTGIRTNTKPNPIKQKLDNTVSQETAHVSPKISGLSIKEKEHEPNAVVNDPTVEANQNKLDVVGTEKTDSKAELQRVQKLDSPVKENGKANDAILPPLASTGTPCAGDESTDSTKNSNKIKNIDMPTDAKKSQLNSQREIRKPQQPDSKKQFDEEDNYSVASPHPHSLNCQKTYITMTGAAASAKTAKFKTTVPVAPVFKCVARLEKRKQFYSEMEKKQAAMEAERLENEARLKEKEQEATRQLRKKMVFKANPMPGFYQEGPPPKPKLKKIPVTRAKSPKLSRRKSCSDVMSRSSTDEKGKESEHIGTSLNNKVQISRKNDDMIAEKSVDCSKTVVEDTNNHTPHTLAKERRADIAVNS